MPQDPDFIPVQRSQETPDFIPVASKQVQPSPAAPKEPMFGHIQTTLGNMAQGLTKNLWDVSTPGIAASLIKRFRPGTLPAQVEKDTTPLKELPNEIGATGAPIMAGGILEEPPPGIARATEAPRPMRAAAASAPEESTFLSRAAEVAKRRISHIPGVQAVKDIDYAFRGAGGPEAPPAPPTPKPPIAKPPIPETNGIQWGTGGKGPLALRGQRIPTEPEPTPETTSQPAAPIARPTIVQPSAGRIGLSGESALRDTLASVDSADLMKIAKSRGINVTQEAQLKPSIAGKRLIGKIADDFSPEELEEFRNNYLENERMAVGRPGEHPLPHQFGDIGAEAQRTMKLQTYFPDVKIPGARMIRSQKAIGLAEPATAGPRGLKAPSETPDLAELGQKSLDAMTISHPDYGEIPRFVYRARDVGEEGVPLKQSHAQAGSNLQQITKYAEPGQRSVEGGEVVKVDLKKLKPTDYVVKTHPDGSKWVQFKRPLDENEVNVVSSQSTGTR